MGRFFIMPLFFFSFVSCVQETRRNQPSDVLPEITNIVSEEAGHGEEFADNSSVEEETPMVPNESLLAEEEVEEKKPIKEVDDLSKIHQKAKEARIYAKKHNMNTRFCFLVDFSYDLYTKRFFVYDLLNSSVVRSAIAAHGYGKGSTEDKVVFSNEPGSRCSSLGKYKVGSRGYSKWGVHFNYKLHGLESTNSNAFRRYVVLHSYEYFECDAPCMVSEGCVIVCDEMMVYLDDILKKSEKPMLLWVFK